MARRVRDCQATGDGVWVYFARHRLTGEVVELPVDDGHGPQPGWKGVRIQVFQSALRRMAAARALGQEGWRVLGYVLSIMTWDNWVVIPQRQIMAQLDLTQPQVSRALRALRDAGVLQQAGAGYPRSMYRLQADLAYKGGYNGWQKRRREERESQRAP